MINSGHMYKDQVNCLLPSVIIIRPICDGVFSVLCQITAV